MIDLIYDYGLTSEIIDSLNSKKFDSSDSMKYDDFEKEINKYGIKTTLNKYGLHEFITKDKPLAYFMILWHRIHKGWSNPYKVFSYINKYEIINYKYRDYNERLMIHYDLLRIYVDKLSGIELEKVDNNHAVNKLFSIMDSDDTVVLLREGVAVFAWE